VFGDKAFRLEDLTFKKLLIIDESAPCTIQICLSQETPGIADVQVASRSASGDRWTTNATGTIRLLEAGQAPEPLFELDETRLRCHEHLTGADYYRGLAAQGLPYGPSFTGIAEIWRRPGEVLARLEPPEIVTASAGAYRVHPALLDMCFQAMGAALRPGQDSPYLPVGLGSLRLWQPPGRELMVHACLTAEAVSSTAAVEGNLWLRDGEGQLVLEVGNFRLERLDSQAGADESLDSWLYDIVWRNRPRAEYHPADVARSWVLLDDGSGLGGMLDTLLNARGAECILRHPAHPAEFPQLLQDALESGRAPCGGVVWLCRPAGLDDPAAAAFESSARLLSLVRALARMGLRDTPRLVLVTGGCQSVGTETAPLVLAQAPLWGLGRTIAMEHPEFACTCIDLRPAAGDAELESLCEELESQDPEAQIALRGDDRYVARLARHTPDDEPFTFSPAPDQAFRLEIDRPGVLDHLRLRAVRQRKPDPGEVEIQVAAAGLNFLDVLAAMGVRPDLPDGPIQLGGECSGTVTAIGQDVRGLQVGDRVIAIGPNSFGTSVTTRADFVIPKPELLPFAEAATIPIAFLTAYYALHHVGRLQAGERLLIHSAAGGVGLASVQVARWLGAEILATAGNPQKRAFLRSLGVADVMDSRSLEFADEVRERTGNQGVNVVLNSLTGEALSRSLALLAPYGRFLEIGKKDVYENHRLGLWPFHKNLSYSMIDLARLLPERPALCSQLLREIVELFRAGSFSPLPHEAFPIARAADAFHQMAQARHIGKIVLSLEDRAGLQIAAASAHASRIHSSATYLITGGLGGLGLSVASWMIGQGARHLVLVGRSGASGAASRSVDEMRAAGAQVRVIHADVGDADALDRVLAAIEGDMPRLAGVIHAAGVLEDSTLLQLDLERLRRVMAPKVAGAWNLHRATRDQSLDFFVLYSSGSALLGSPGQGNYNAGNAFLDGLAHYRRRQGWPALSIDWGPFSEVGMVAGPEWTARLASRGMGSLTSRQGTSALGRLLGHRSPQIAVLPLNLRQWRQVYPRFAQVPFFSELIEAGEHEGTAGPVDHGLRQQLTAADAKGRLALLEQHVREQIASVLRLPAERVGVRTPLHSLGMDSLMALELRNRLEDKLGVRLPATLVWQHPTVAALADHLGGLLSPATASATRTPPLERAPAANALDRIAQLSDEDVERLFAEKIAGRAVEES
jgi:NADPH:quinone reductase-like Zn-dependent oxidoreductase/acyl carrier protein